MSDRPTPLDQAPAKLIYPKVLKICQQCNQERRIVENRKLCDICRTLNARIHRGEVRPPDFKEVNTHGYKEPMQKVEDGFGYFGAITETNDGKHIQCHICGYYFSRLGSHIINKHSMKPRDYCINYGLRIKEGLLSTDARKQAQENYNKYARKTPEEFKAMSVKARAAIATNSIELKGHGWSAQKRNETGTCREQTIAKIQALAEMYGGKPTYNAYRAEFGGIDVINHWFGTWQEAVKAAGFDSYDDTLKQRRGELKAQIIDGIFKFYQQNGRTPQSSDCTTCDYLPNYKAIVRTFGTFNAARAAAGVPLLVYYKRHWVELAEGEELPGAIVPSLGKGIFA